ncbi:FixH family protein [Leptolyngbya sp. BC1307]|uniref:FixH family protein n=1 Tax=Leptolyngbya sp. BC1307 TaxID=2029589 RepID=UPI000EFAE64F|nr:FixH family protein [Leptolyngbya sp. BC1307]
MKKLFFSLIALSVVATGCASNSAPDTAAAPDAAETSAAMTGEMDGMEGMLSMPSTSEGDYEFTLVSPEAVSTGDAEVVVAVKDAATGEPVATDDLAVDIYMMPMEGMERMATESEVTPGSEPGTYSVKTYLGMAGPWVVHSVLEEDGKEGVGHLLVEAQ